MLKLSSQFGQFWFFDARYFGIRNHNVLIFLKFPKKPKFLTVIFIHKCIGILSSNVNLYNSQIFIVSKSYIFLFGTWLGQDQDYLGESPEWLFRYLLLL